MKQKLTNFSIKVDSAEEIAGDLFERNIQFQREIQNLQTLNNRLKTALANLVGSEDKEELVRMRKLIDNVPEPERAYLLAAIDLLIETI
jgi:hypothetical protein